MSNQIPLTQKQENFVLNILQGMTQHDAYIAVYNTKRMLTNSIDRAACQLAQLPKITARITDLRSVNACKTKMERGEREERLSTIGREDIISAKGTPLRGPNISAIDLLNKMDNIYEPTKIDITPGLEELLRKLQGRKELPEGTE